MNSNELLDYLNHPEKLQQPQAEQLLRVLEEYPYSGVLQVLYLKALKNQNNYLYPKQLKRAAIAVPDRKALYYWVEAEADLPPKVASPERPKIEFQPEPKPNVAEVTTPGIPIPQPELNQPPVQVPPAAVAPLVQPVMPVAAEVEPAAPIQAVPKAPVIAEVDLDLANLPASVRETVLRARRIRQQLGNAFNDAAPNEKQTPPTPTEITPPETPKVVITLPAPVPEPEVIVPQPEIITPTEQPVVAVPEPEPEISLAKPEAIEVAQEPIPKTKHSFLEWLSADEELSNGNKPDAAPLEVLPAEFEVNMPEEAASESEIEQPEASAPKPSTEEVKDLYESFMEKRPKPRLDFKASDTGAIDTASLSTSDYASYITETLAQVYVKQKLYDRAINAYEILRLKYPEKSGLFAARILEIKRLLND